MLSLCFSALDPTLCEERILNSLVANAYLLKVLDWDDARIPQMWRIKVENTAENWKQMEISERY